jgi:GAF domain-containing protein
VPSERLLRVLAALRLTGGAEPGVADVCALSVELAGVTGVGLMLMPGDVPRASVGMTDEVSALIEDLQYTLGEGPCVDAHRQDRPVLEPDLAEPAEARWPAFSPPAVEAGVRAVFGFPLRIGAVRLGALNLYRDRPGPLDDEQHADTLVLASVATTTIVAAQTLAPSGALAAELEGSSNLHLVVHQASGMVSVQLGVDVGEALVRLRAYAFVQGRLVRDVARDVVQRRIRLDDDDHGRPDR